MKRTTIMLASVFLLAACNDDSPSEPNGDAPTVTATVPESAASDVPRNTPITATFSEAMNAATLSATTFQLRDGATLIPATVTYTGMTATLTPTSTLGPDITFTASISTAAENAAGTGLADAETWTFTTVASPVDGPAEVDLGTSGGYAILAKSGVSTTGSSSVVGDVGVSPASAASITGFGLSSPPTDHTTSSLVTGEVRAADYDPPTPADLTTAVLDMEAAYTDAAGRTLPDFTELGAGDIDGLTLSPGLYKWGTGVSFASGVTLSGPASAVWIFQIAQDLTVGNGAAVTLSGGALAENVFWQVGGAATLGTTSAFNGIILSQTGVVFNTSSTITGRALAQTAVTLDATAVTQP